MCDLAIEFAIRDHTRTWISLSLRAKLQPLFATASATLSRLFIVVGSLGWTGSRDAEPTDQPGGGASSSRGNKRLSSAERQVGACKTRRRGEARASERVCLWRPWRESAFVLSHTLRLTPSRASALTSPLFFVASRLVSSTDFPAKIDRPTTVGSSIPFVFLSSSSWLRAIKGFTSLF